MIYTGLTEDMQRDMKASHDKAINDHLELWCKEEIKPSDPGSRMLARHIYQNYTGWCKRVRCVPVTIARWGRFMKRRFYAVTIKGLRVYHGVAFRDIEERTAIIGEMEREKQPGYVATAAQDIEGEI